MLSKATAAVYAGSKFTRNTPMNINRALGIATLLFTMTPSLLGEEPSPARTRADFVVAVTGNDRHPGTETQPLATIGGARDAVRKLRKAEPGRDVLVLVRGGVYHVDEPLLFSPEDSGREGGAVTYAAYPGEQPVLSGGRRITGFQPGPDGLWTVKASELHSRPWRFEQLYVNGRRAVRARTPNRFYFYMNATRRSGVDPATGRPGKLDDRMFLANSRDLAPLSALPPERLRDVVVASYHSWHISRQYVASLRAESGEVFLTGSCGIPFFTYTQNERYFLENYREALDAPGEWFLDRDGTLHYKPLAGEDLKTAEVIAPVADELLHFLGDDTRPVKHITLRGLSLAHSGYRLPPEGQSSPQAACKVSAAIMADYACGIVLEDCRIQHTGTYGVWFRDGCRDCSVRRCLFEDLGAGGVRVGQTDRVPKPAEQTSHIAIDNNILRSAGRLWADAVGILIGHSGDNQVTHNDISGMPYSGISAGWRWGYGEVPSVRNSIRFNQIHHLGWDVLADMGGIYTLGEAPGTVLGNNVIHDIDGNGDSSMHGIYNDNSTSRMIVENNLVYRVRDGGYKIGSGKNNVVRNNVFVAVPRQSSRYDNPLMFCMYYPVETHVAAIFEKNILCGSGGNLFSIPAAFGDRLQFRDNLYWDPSGGALDFLGKSFDEWQRLGRDAGSIVADPKFVDPARDDFRLQADSPALALGCAPIDYAQAGVYGDPAWIRKAREVQYPPCEHAPPGPPITFFDDFEQTPVGDPPALARVQLGERAGSIAVTEELAAGGRRCLKITDTHGLKYAHDPHFYYSPRQNRGRATLAFDLRIEPESQLYCEWREYPGIPYFHTGPRVAIRGAELTAPGNPPLPVPVGKWFHVEMSAGQGDEADGTWQLTVVLPGEAPKRFNLTTASPQFRATTWLGFVSDAAHDAVYYLDNLRLSNPAE